jgi:site-specific DNA-methyltransferase (adenine-specific)
MLTPYYEDDYVLLYHGDNLEILPDICEVDCVLTDPPYNISANHEKNSEFHYKKNNNTNGLDFGDWDKNFNLKIHYGLVMPLLKKGGTVVTFCGFEQAHDVLTVFNENNIKYRRFLVMQKNMVFPNMIERLYVSDVELMIYGTKSGAKYTFNRQNAPFDRCVINAKSRSNVAHPTPKPLKVIEELVLRHTNAGDLVLDPFGGSGTTALACKRNGRFCIMIEQDKKYCDLIVSRLKQDVLPLFV